MTARVTIDTAEFHEAILWCINRQGRGTYTYVIANMLNMRAYFEKPLCVTTTQVRRELQRMERAGIVKRVAAYSRAYIAWAISEQPAQ